MAFAFVRSLTIAGAMRFFHTPPPYLLFFGEKCGLFALVFPVFLYSKDSPKGFDCKLPIVADGFQKALVLHEIIYPIEESKGLLLLEKGDRDSGG